MSIDVSMQDRTAVVTGASSGIGRAIAERLGGAGATVYLVGRTEGPMQDSVSAIDEAGGRGIAVALDVRDGDALRALIDRAAEETGRLDVMVNNAGLGHLGDVLDSDPEQWAEMFDVNVLALLVGCQAAVGAMRETGSGGHIVNISSIAALRTEAGVYGATKAAVNYLTTAMRQELEEDDIRVTSLMPGVVGTNFARHAEPETLETIAALSGTEAEIVQGERLPDDVVGKPLPLHDLGVGPGEGGDGLEGLGLGVAGEVGAHHPRHQ
jgi:NADP-dependent 3-hydroxy acid dehydrogenase YdfG